jgi:hypothetical protein
VPWCHALDQECSIEKPKARSCIECIYIARYGARDEEDLHQGIIKLFDSIDKHRKRST